MNINKKKLSIILIIISAALAIVGFVILPDIVKVKMDGSNPLPKALAVIIPFLIVSVSSLMYIKAIVQKEIKYLILSVFGIAIQIFTLIANKITF